MKCAKHSLKRQRIQRLVAKFLLVMVLMMYSMNNIYIREVEAFSTGANNSSTEIWQWKLLRNKSDFPISSTPVVMSFGDKVVSGEESARQGSRSKGFYVSLTDGETLANTVLEPVGDTDMFITRGMPPYFYMGRWDTNDGGRYYFSPSNNKNKYLEHIDKNAFESGCDNWWYETEQQCHNDENVYDVHDVYWMFRVREYGDGVFGFYTPNTGKDFYFCSDFTGSNRFGIDNHSNGDASTKIRLYVGTKISDVTVLRTTGSTVYTVKSGEVMTVKDITYLPRNYTVKIEDGAILIVSGRFICNGTIENHGTLIVDDGGFIFPLDGEYYDGRLKCVSGDVLIRKNGIISLKKLIANSSGSIINYGTLNATAVNLAAPLIDNKEGGYIFFGCSPNRSHVYTGSDYQDSRGSYRNSVAYCCGGGRYDTAYAPTGFTISGKYRLINNGYIKLHSWSNVYSLGTYTVEGNQVQTYEFSWVYAGVYKIGNY